ncbi:MAG: hypothetical protein KDD69_01315 [Bdellovibrionales bacterium]|nr:hypothetical protein [Bdellovibrionales bacterium]
MEDELRAIFGRITETYTVPLRLSSRCEAKVYYRVEDLSSEDIEQCSQYISERMVKVCQPALPELLVSLRGNFTGLATMLARELAPPGESLEVVSLEQIESGNGVTNRLKGANVALVNDVITTARSCLEAHTKITLMGASVLCWSCLIDRTFGPGPVPVVAAFTGAPINLLEEIP